jgi:voltage-gated potassium channel
LAQASIGAVVVLFIAIVLGSALVVHYEYGQPGADIESYDDAIWWAFETVSTVGYGDFVPVTEPGRVVAIMLMVVGVGLASVAAASVISFFSGNKKALDGDASPDAGAAANAGASAGASTGAGATANVDGGAGASAGNASTSEQILNRLDALEAKLDQLISRSRQ